MDESALQHRLAVIERRQSLILWLLVGVYVFAAGWILVEHVEAVTVWHAGSGVVFLAAVTSLAGLYRRRQARS